MPRLSLRRPATRRSPWSLTGSRGRPVIALSFGPAAAAATATEPSSTPGRRSIDNLDAGSAPGHAHVARQRRPLVTPVDDEIVPLGLARDGFLDRRMQQLVALGGAQRSAQIRGVLLPQAHVEGSRAGDPNPIAGFAEIVGERGDEAEAAAGLRDADVARRAAGAIIQVGERKALGEPRTYYRQRKILIEPSLADVAERHHFDQGQVHPAPVRPFDERAKLVLVHALERHCVDLDL